MNLIEPIGGTSKEKNIYSWVQNLAIVIPFSVNRVLLTCIKIEVFRQNRINIDTM